MHSEKIRKWAELLLDTGKRNNLINFKDSKSSSVEIVVPDCRKLAEKAARLAEFEVYEPPKELLKKEDEEADVVMPLTEYVALFGPKLKKANQILLYNAGGNALRALRNIGRKASSAIEETGVNIAYIAFCFVYWRESAGEAFRAPLLLAPIAIKRNSLVEPYHIKVIDDIIVNPTFAFKMQNEYNVRLPEFDEDEGLDAFLTKVGSIFKGLGWEIAYDCKIGTFSFQKINMYKDLEDNVDKILQNGNVRLLLGEKRETVFPTGADALTETAEESDLHCVVDADHSQTEAIKMAKKGDSFVLQGPPGTGKSQTITNIIAECLATGKKVLFVSEKLAALNVVYEKLKKAGLEEFCLELHSYKANKKSFIEELCRTLKLPKSVVSDRAEKEVGVKKRLEKELDDYVGELHKKRKGIDKSLYELYEEACACTEAAETDYVIPGIAGRDEKSLQDALNSLTLYAGYTKFIGETPEKYVWYGYRGESSYETRLQLKKDAKQLADLCADFCRFREDIKGAYGMDFSSLDQGKEYAELVKFLAGSRFLAPSALIKGRMKNLKEAAEKLLLCSTEVKEKKAYLDSRFSSEIFKKDGEQMLIRLRGRYSGAITRLFSREYKDLVGEIAILKKDGGKMKYGELCGYIQILKDYQEKEKEFAELEKAVKGYLTEEFRGADTDFLALEKETSEGEKYFVRGLAVGKLSSVSPDEFEREKPVLRRLADGINKTIAASEGAETRLRRQFDPKQYDIGKMPPEKTGEKMEACSERIDEVENWCKFIKLVEKLKKEGVYDFIEHARAKDIPVGSYLDTYKKVFCMQWIDSILSESAVLQNLSRIPHDEFVSQFIEKDKLGFDINKAKINAVLSEERPDLDLIAQGSAVSVLLHEGQKKKKQKGIRTLMAEISDLILQIKPCFLMSPLSVSTFLGADMRFDVVVFDEASQIFPQDAIGAIYRGAQLIVAGDSKQMPPSNFFNTVAEDEDEDEEGITDFDSILDMCSVVFPQRRLKWHYRSRFEQLIAFSNKHFYDDDLITFPSPKKDIWGLGVDFCPVDGGVFDRRTKTNRKEAEKIADLVFEHFKTYPERSLGVVAFSISQQNLIENLIFKRRRADPSMEAFFSADREEPFFVKNLETVQGDERDTIIFSIAYAKDDAGKFYHNFGPINKQGGERRLNVAVTRAKYNVQVVSSIRYTDIDPSRSSSEGAMLLREYLKYAEEGVPLAIEYAKKAALGSSMAFEEEVCDFLRKNGFVMDANVGRSAYKIDMAVKNAQTEDYVLAVECDGTTYRSTKTVRDRDRLRREVLERMGWGYYRIWSVDWFGNKTQEKARLLAAAKKKAMAAPTKEVKPENKEVSFEVEAEAAKFVFPTYKTVDPMRARGAYYLEKVYDVLTVEAPLSEEWLMKRSLTLLGGTKLNDSVKETYEWYMKKAAQYRIERRGGFLYLRGKEIPMLRVPEKGDTVIRDVKYICLEELAKGLLEVIKKNVKLEKSSLYRLIANKLGFSRVGDAMYDRFENALKLLDGEVEVRWETVYLRT